MTRTVGFFHNGAKGSFQKQYAAFVRRLYDFIEEDDVTIVESWAGDDTSRTVDQHVAALAAGGVKVLVAAGGPPSALAAMKATVANRIPVVFTSVADPVGLKLVADLDKPGGNMTGIAGLTSELDGKRLQILREYIGGTGGASVGVLNNKNRPYLDDQFRDLEAAAKTLNITLVRKDVENLNEIKTEIAALRGARVSAMLVTADSMFNNLRKEVVKAAQGLPTIYQWREFPEAGGLMSFGPSILDAYEKVAEYVGLILDGASPADLPVSLPDRLELVVNMRIAHAEGFTIPASILSRAEFVRARLRTRQAMALAE
jgi:putative ABC transport system substrate-binding protein